MCSSPMEPLHLDLSGPHPDQAAGRRLRVTISDLKRSGHGLALNYYGRMKFSRAGCTPSSNRLLLALETLRA